MNAASGWAIAVWAAVSVLSLWVWFPTRSRGRPPLDRTGILLATATWLVVGTGVVALLAALGGPAPPPWSWVAVAVAGVAALLTGGALTYTLLALADPSARPGAPRVQLTTLRGGAWIGALERLAMLAAVLSGWPEGAAVIVAVKAFARYPELKSGQATGAIERFIIGTFASLSWAAACAGIARILT